MTQEVADKHGVRSTRDETARSMPQPVNTDRSQAGGLAFALVATPKRRGIEPATEPVDQDIVLGARGRCVELLGRDTPARTEAGLYR